MTRVIHTGDTHVGYQQYHSPERREDFLRAFEGVVEDAVSDGVDAVVHAGDLFHDRRPGLRDLMGTLGVLRRLAEADIPFLAVVGNHEGTRDGQWLDLFESLGLATRLDETPCRVGDVAFYGLDYVPRSRRDALDYEFAAHDADHAALVGHGLFQPFAHGDWDAETVLEESNVAFDTMLLGDNHAPGTKEVRGAWVTYCGSTERASAEERDERGYNIVEFGAGADPEGSDAETAGTGDVRITRRGLSTREFVFVDLDLGETEGVERVRERLREQDLEGAVVVVSVTGEGEAFAPADVEQFARERGALVARVTDHRERETVEDVPEVNFADPDQAVRERLRERGLSVAARRLDETVRSDEVADSNVRETVERRVRELLEEGEPADFAPDTGADGTADATDVEAEAGDDHGADADAPTDRETAAEADGGTPADAPTSADDGGVDRDGEDQSSMGEFL